MMDDGTFKMVDGILANHSDGDQRKTARVILGMAADKDLKENKTHYLFDVAVTLSRRFAIQKDTVLSWWLESIVRDLKSQAEVLDQIQELYDKLKEKMVGNGRN